MRNLLLRSRLALPQRVVSLLVLVLMYVGLGCSQLPGQEGGGERGAVSDDTGGTDTATVRAVVTLLNNNPPDAVGDTLTVAEDSAATVVDVLANDSIAPDTGETLTVESVTQPAIGSVTLTGGVVDFTPAANFSGTVTFTYTASDGNGGTDTAMVTVMVTPVNDPPSVVDDTLTVTENSAVTVVDVLANDSSAPDTGETLVVTAVTQPTTGLVTFTSGEVRYQSSASFSGTDTFTYTVSDGNGGTDIGTVMVTVIPLPPTAPVVVTPANGSTTYDNTPTYGGSAEPGTTVTLIVDGIAVDSTPADGAGNWNFTQPTVLSDGLHTVKATATDASNNTSPASNSNTFTVDTTAPAAPVVAMPAHGSTTIDKTPTYSGSAEPGSTVTVIVDGTPVGNASWADGAGNWSFTQVMDLEDGPHHVKVRTTDGAGNTSPESNTHAFTVDTALSTGGWRPMGSLAADRSWHTATLLPDGKILIAGGKNAGGALSRAELYDPETRSWRPTGSLAAARFGHTATLLPDGKVLVAGGESAGVSLTSAELYDPQEGSWSSTFALTTARASHTATLLSSGKVLVTGGSSSPGSYVANAEVYDSLTGWNPAGTLADARDRHTATLLSNGKVLVTGGFNTTGELTSAELYGPGAMEWNSAGTLAAPRSSHTATLLDDGRVLITGGHGSGSPLASAELYDPGTGWWSQAGALAVPRRLHTATLLPSGKVLVTGGEGTIGPLASTEVYDPRTDVWSPTGALATARASHSAMQMSSGKILIVGGSSAPASFLGSAEVYESTGTSSLTGALNEARTDFMAVLLPTEEEVLVVGGANASGSLASAELYNPMTQTWTRTPDMEMARSSATATLLLSGEVLVAGGKGPGGTGLRATGPDTALSSAELFNPKTKTWRRTGSMGAPRHSHAAVLLSSGKVLITGGVDEHDAPLSTTEVYDPAQGTWRKTKAMNTPRRAPLVVQLPSGQVLVAGGTDKDGKPLASAEVYDPEHDRWDDTHQMNAPRASSTAVLLSTGQVLVAGGAADKDQALKSAEVYHPVEKKWEPMGELAQARKSHSALLLPTGNVLVVGGISGSVTLDDVEVFELSQKKWERKSRLSTPSKDSMTVLLPTGQVLVIAGTSSSGDALKRAEQYAEHDAAITPPPVVHPLKAQKPGASLQVLGSGFIEKNSGRPGLVRVMVLPRGELRDVRPRTNSDSSLEMTLPEVPEGHHLLFVLVRGVAGGRGLHVDGTPPGAPLVKGYRPTPQPAVEGTAEAGSTVQVQLSSGQTGTANTDGTGAWYLPLEQVLLDAEYAASATAWDEAGNASAVSTVTFIVDTRAPEPPRWEPVRTPLNVSRPPLSGTAEPLSQITLYVDGKPEGSISADKEGYWSGTPSTKLGDGMHTATVTAKDGAGNGSLDSEPLRFRVDTLEPARPEVLTPREGAIEASRTPLISGTAEPRSTVRVMLDGAKAHEVTADAEGHWSFQPATELADEAHTVSATATDEAGNSSPESAPRRFTVGSTLSWEGGGLSCAASPGEPSLVLLGLAALGRFLSRRRHTRRSGSILLLVACMWLGCGPQLNSQIEGFPAGDSGAMTVGAKQHPWAAPQLAPTQAAGWSSAPPMSTTRYNHTATLLPSGKVLVAGGLNASGGSALNSTQLYDLHTGKWQPGPPMRAARYNHTATLLPSGKVLVAGGIDSQDKALDKAEVYDPETGNWKETGKMIQARYYRTATLLLSGQVLVTGGTLNGEDGLPDVEVYDPKTDTWREEDAMNHARFRHTATLLPSGKVLVIGGAGEKDIEEYDPGGTWTVHIGSLITHRSGHTATLLPSDRILVVGGTADDGGFLATAEVYDRGSQLSRETAPMSEARTLHTATLLFSGKVLVAGGLTGSLSSPSGLPWAQEYDPENGTWSPGLSLSSARFQHAATLLPSGMILVTGGYHTQALDSVEVYVPERGRWLAELALPRARWGHAVTLLPSGKVLITGGADSQGRALESLEVYDPVTGTWQESRQTLHFARYHHTATLLPSGKVLVAGGTTDGTNGLTRVEVYDPTTGLWSEEAPMSQARFKHTATLLASGQVLVTGGSPERDTEEYVPERHTWEPAGELTIHRSAHSATLLPSGKVLIIGGTADDMNGLDTVELYDPGSRQWSEVGSMSSPRFRHTATLLPSGQVLVTGGSVSANIAQNSTALFDPASGSWTTGSSLNTSRSAHSATLLPSGQVLIAGGKSNSRVLGDAEVYDPVLGSWSLTSSLVTARLHHTATLLPSGQVLLFGGENGGGALASAQVYEPNGKHSRPDIDLIPARPRMTKSQLELTGRHLRSHSESSGGNARSAGSTLPLVSLIALDGGGLTRIVPLDESSDTALTFKLPEVATGYYVVSVMTRGISGGQLVLVDGTPPAAPLVTSPLLRQDVFNSKPGITGTTQPGSKVRVSLRTAEAGEPQADETGAWSEAQVHETGTWTYTPEEPLEPGPQTLWVMATDEAGNDSARSSVGFVIALPMSHYGWGCASAPVLPASGVWLLVALLLRRRSPSTRRAWPHRRA